MYQENSIINIRPSESLLMFRHIKQISLFVLLMASSPLTVLAEQTEEWCEARWVSDSGSLISFQTEIPSLDNMLSKWHSYEPICGKTVTYITHLALIQILKKDFSAAKITLAKTDNKNAYGYLVDSAKVQLEIQQGIASGKEFTKDDFSKFEDIYLKIVDNYPAWLNGYALLGGIQTELGKHKKAIVNLKKAEKGQNYDLNYVYRSLTISHVALNQNKEALDAADIAVSLNSDIFSDPLFAIAYANASTEEGFLGDSQNALKALLLKHPEIESNPKFVAAAKNFRRAFDKQQNR